MLVFRLHFLKTDQIEVDVEAEHGWQAEEAAYNMIDRGEVDWEWTPYHDEGEWESYVGPAINGAAPDHGVCLDDNGELTILPISEARKRGMEETDEERKRREFAEAEAAGQQKLAIEEAGG